METCAVCQDEQQIVIRIATDPVCEDCVVSGIIPKFLAALQHEADYPPTWGRYKLHPQVFRQWLDNADEVLRKYEEKEVEYDTPAAIRLYCGQCQAFCCEKDMRRLIRLGCPECEALICAACGGLDENDGSHECPKPDDPFAELMRGRDYQRCPKEDCGIPVELKDGCNAMLCRSCYTGFCFICGERADHNSQHWQAGSSCPRFNQPASEHAHFDHAPPPLDPPTAAAIIQRMDQGGRVDEMVRALPPLPLLPILADADPANAMFQRLQLEQDRADELLATELGILMRRHHGQVDAMLEVAHTVTVDNEMAGRQMPAFMPAAVDVMLQLRANLDIYIYRERLRADLAGFVRRHEAIVNFALGRGGSEMRRRSRMIQRHFPLLRRIVQVYSTVAESRPPLWGLEAAAAAGRGE